jgi:pimeloyl-ACP methyl ester carboxylesterase
MQEIKNGDVRIDYQVYGQGSTTLLFVHGSFIDQTYWAEQVKFFSPGYKVVTLDLAAHGNSGRNRSNWTIESFGEDVVTVMKELALQNVILIGHSMGAQVILEAADAYPQAVKGSIAIDFFKNAATPMPPEMQQQADAILQKMHTDFAGTSEQYVHMVLVTPQTDKALTDRIVNAYRNAYPEMGIKALESIFGYAMRERALLEKLAVKLYLINVDYMPTNEQPLKTYAGSDYQLTHMPGTSHYPMIENPQLFNQLLKEVIADIEASA